MTAKGTSWRLSERFHSSYDRSPSGCWLWKRQRNNRGYGNLQNRGRRALAHRVSWELHYGAPPGDLFVLHRCDTPSCVNPEHLFLGDNSENMRDCSRKGRAKSGYEKLDANKVRHMRDLYRVERIKQAELAELFGVTQATVSEVVNGKTWRHVA